MAELPDFQSWLRLWGTGLCIMFHVCDVHSTPHLPSLLIVVDPASTLYISNGTLNEENRWSQVFFFRLFPHSYSWWLDATDRCLSYRCLQLILTPLSVRWLNTTPCNDIPYIQPTLGGNFSQIYLNGVNFWMFYLSCVTLIFITQICNGWHHFK